MTRRQILALVLAILLSWCANALAAQSPGRSRIRIEAEIHSPGKRVISLCSTPLELFGTNQNCAYEWNGEADVDAQESSVPSICETLAEESPVVARNREWVLSRKSRPQEALFLINCASELAWAWDRAFSTQADPSEVDRHRGVQPLVRPSAVAQGFKPYEKRFALVVGIDDYRGDVPPLLYAETDARAVADLLRKQLGFNEVVLLLNEQAHRDGILGALFDLKEKMGSEDQMFFYFAGHGISFGEGRNEIGYLIPHNATSLRAEKSVSLQALSMIALREQLVTLPAKHVLVAIDACFGGLAASMSRSLSSIHSSHYLRVITASRARQILTAGRRGQEVLERSAWGHSAFTSKLLEGLKKRIADGNADGLVTATELSSYLGPAVTKMTEGAQTPQFAELEPDEGEFVFVLPEPQLSSSAPEIGTLGYDLVFVIDTTAGMERWFLPTSEALNTFFAKIQADMASSDLIIPFRVGLLFFRDRKLLKDCDMGYLLHWEAELTEDVPAVVRALATAQASNCNSEEAAESVYDALNRAVLDPQWSDGNFKVVLLVGDSPPHSPSYKEKNPLGLDVDAIHRESEVRNIRLMTLKIGLADEAEFEALALFADDSVKGRFRAVEPNPGAYKDALLSFLNEEWQLLTAGNKAVRAGVTKRRATQSPFEF